MARMPTVEIDGKMRAEIVRLQDELRSTLDTVADLRHRLVVEKADAVAAFAIQVEKRLCEALGRPWSAHGISIDSLINELSQK